VEYGASGALGRSASGRIECRSVRKTYRDAAEGTEIVALDGLTLDIEPSEFLPLLAERDPQLQAPARRIVDALLARESGLAIARLEECTDDGARVRLTRALVDGHLTPRGLVLLRHQYQLTWAETCVFVEYYLNDLALTVTSLEPERRWRPDKQ